MIDKNKLEILAQKEIEKLVEEKKASYLNWGNKMGEIVYVGNKIFWKHALDHYMKIGYRVDEDLK